MVITPVLVPVPMLVFPLPEVLISAPPLTVNPPVPCIDPVVAFTPTNDAAPAPEIDH